MRLPGNIPGLHPCRTELGACRTTMAVERHSSPTSGLLPQLTACCKYSSHYMKGTLIKGNSMF